MTQIVKDVDRLMYWDMVPLLKTVLNERDCMVLGMRLQGYTYARIGKTFGFSHERARQIEAKSWAKFLRAIRQRLEAEFELKQRDNLLRPCSVHDLIELPDGNWYCENCHKTFDHELNKEVKHG